MKTMKKTIKQRAREYLLTLAYPANVKPIQISRELKIPASSARRIVQELFREGFECAPTVIPKKPERYPQTDLTKERRVDPAKSPLSEAKQELIDAKDFAQAQFAVMQAHMSAVLEACK